MIAFLKEQETAFRWTAKVKMLKKGSAQNGVIIWTSIIIAALITVNWTIGNMVPHHYNIETINADIEGIQGKINAACNSFIYKAKYNPHTEEGTLIISNNTTCVNNTISLCRINLCSTGLDANFDLSNLTYIIIEKNENQFNIYRE